MSNETVGFIGLGLMGHGMAKNIVEKGFPLTVTAHSNRTPIDSLGTRWNKRFHTWRMDWDEQAISLFVDDQLLNRVELKDLVNQDGSGFNPFKQPHYILLNLALGGDNGGDPAATKFPRRYEIDYVRVYQKGS